MKLELPRFTERFGSVRINNVQRVLLLESNPNNGPDPTGICNVPRDDIRKVLARMAIVIPVKDERLKVAEGVISAIPEECPVILVSNSKRASVDRYRMELEMVEQYAHYTRRPIWMVHQRDPGLGRALREVGYTELLDDEGLVNHGKAEGLVVGMLLAKAADKEFVGFVDADNYIPGAVHEYVTIYAAAFSLARSPYTMVRILWSSKPKILESSLYFSKWGRVSETTNRFLNRLVSSFSGFESEVIKTGNSGDHALSMPLAETLEFRPKFAIETQEIVNVLEQFGGILEPRAKGMMDEGAEIFQVETRNPHFHDEKGPEHIEEMMRQSLNVIYDSPLCPDSLREEIRQHRQDERPPPPPRKIRPFGGVDAAAFHRSLLESGALSEHGRGR